MHGDVAGLAAHLADEHRQIPRREQAAHRDRRGGDERPADDQRDREAGPRREERAARQAEEPAVELDEAVPEGELVEVWLMLAVPLEVHVLVLDPVAVELDEAVPEGELVPV